MSTRKTVFIGLVPLIPHLTYQVTVLDENLHPFLNKEVTQEEAVALFSEQEKAIAGLSLPMRPNKGLVNQNSVKQTSRGRSTPKKIDKRLCEYILNQKGIKTPSTLTNVENCPLWMKQGFSFYNRMAEINYLPYPETENEKWFFETCPEGVYRSILGKPLLPLKTLEGRLQRMLLLYDLGIRIMDPMVFFEEVTRHRIIQGSLPMNSLMSMPEIESTAAAYMAWRMIDQPNTVIKLGDMQEGTLLLPFWKELETPVQLEAQQMEIFG